MTGTLVEHPCADRATFLTEHPTPPDMSSSEVNFKIQDEGRLAELGYTQELRREWSLTHNFGASFSIIVSENRAISMLGYRG